MQQFLMWQPAAPQETSTDKFYLGIANRLALEARRQRLFPSYPEKVVERAAMAMTGYYQDVISDAGIWRTFITWCRNNYGYTVPFYDDGADYLDFELNKADVRFITWYALSMNYEGRRVCNPLDEEIVGGADKWWEILEEAYEEAPIPEDYRLTHELEMHAKEDSEAIYKLGDWLFMHCYLMTPAYALTLSEIASEIDLSKEDGLIMLRERMEKSMSEDPTGPLALYLSEWLYLIVDGKLPKAKKKDPVQPHKFYTLFTQATGGKTIEFFDSYAKLNDFFISALGWEKDEEHLPQMKNSSDFILMVDEEKGMLLARDIARCIAAPENPLYDKEYAKAHAMELLTERGACPGDLLRRVLASGWLPDAAFPGSADTRLVVRHADFIARCFLQQYYRGD